nr:unnamed protein product [Callosobruchus analis]
MNNLPGSQLRNDVEIIRDVHENLYDSDDEIPLSQLYARGSTSTVEAPGHPAPKKSKIRSWTVEDISHTPVVEWNKSVGPMQELTPLQLFECFFDDEVINMVVEFTNRYALQKNSDSVVSTTEMKCFLGVLILSGYVIYPRRFMYWENRNDTHNIMVTEAISRDFHIL